MPTTRKSRASTGPAQKGTQKTLAFTNSKVTKPSPLNPKANKNALTTVSVPVPKSRSATPSSTTAVDIIEEKAQTGLNKSEEKTEAELRAGKITDAQINRYWKAREDERIAKRVHQESLGVEEKVLRLFDMSSSYGPCIGITRMKRWVRAEKLGLNPPIEVLAVVLKEEGKGNSKIERAYVDELLSSKIGVES